MLECNDLYASYGRMTIVRGVSLSVRPGEFVALIGPNGAGKTTLLKAIVGLLPATRGTASFDGQPIGGLDPAEIVARGIALVPHGRMIFQSMTVRENLRLGGFRVPADRIDERMARVLEAFPALRERLPHPGGTLSGGQQQMLAIARAMMSGPRLLILDEPSTGLAPVIVESICRTMTELSRDGTMILLVEQNAHMALELSSRAYVLEHGSIAVAGDSADLVQDPRVVAAYLG